VFEKRPHRLRDFGLYVVISVLVVSVILVFAAKGWGAGWSRWVALGLGTGLIFYYWLRMCRTVWRLYSFWYTSGILLTLHTAFWIILLRHSPEFRPTWFAGQLFVVELAAFPLLADWINALFERHHRRKGAKSQ
jgi:hypothetical protein